MGDIEGLIRLFGVLAMLQLKSWSVMGESHHPTFVGNCYSHVFILMHPVDEFSLKGMRTWGQSMVETKRVRGEMEYKIFNTSDGKLIWRFSSSYRKLLDRVAFKILSNINDGAPPYLFI